MTDIVGVGVATSALFAGSLPQPKATDIRKIENTPLTNVLTL
jgi:hypothetical protein